MDPVCPWTKLKRRTEKSSLQESLCWGCKSPGKCLEFLFENAARGEGDQATKHQQESENTNSKNVLPPFSSSLNVKTEKSFQRGSLVGVTGTQLGFYSPQRIFRKQPYPYIGSGAMQTVSSWRMGLLCLSPAPRTMGTGSVTMTSRRRCLTSPRPHAPLCPVHVPVQSRVLSGSFPSCPARYTTAE